MGDWTEVELTAGCAHAPPDDYIYLPMGSAMPAGRRVLVEHGKQQRLMKPGIRADEGEGACVSGTTLAAFGARGTRVRYREVGWAETIWRDQGLFLQFAIALVTLAGAVLTAWGAFIKASAEPVDSFAHVTAFVTLTIALVLSVGKLYSDYRSV